jgi:hypothetical protein
LRCTILHSHFLTANCTHIVCFSKFFFLNHIFFIIFLTMEPFQEPSFLSQMMMTTSGSSLPLSILPHTQHRLFHRKIGKMIDFTTLLMDLLKKKLLCQQHEQLDTIVMVGNFNKNQKRHFYRSFYVFGLKFSPKYTRYGKRNFFCILCTLD